MNSKQSKDLWLSTVKTCETPSVLIGEYTSYQVHQDPKHLGFVLARYKFCAKMLEQKENILEIGCGDAFGAPLVAAAVKSLTCIDIDSDMIPKNSERLSFVENLKFEVFEILKAPYKQKMDGMYSIDVLEHLYPEEEESFFNNIIGSLKGNGVLVLGTPNVTSEPYASEASRKAHINLKNHKELLALGNQYFENTFLFGMNDEIVHTGYPPMCHFLWILCVGPKKTS